MDDQLATQRDWSNLPNVVLSQVLKCLKSTDTDCRRLRAVCASWRSSICPPPPPLHFPFQVITPPNESAPHDVDLGLLTQKVVYLISLPSQSSNNSATATSSDVWLTWVEETLHPSNIWKLQNPVWGVVINKSDRLPKLGAKVNLLDYRISEVCRSYHLLRGSSSVPTASYKTVLLSDHENFWLLSLSFNLKLFLYNSGTDKWVDISHRSCSGSIADIIAYQGKFYGANEEGKLIVIDPVTFEVKEIIKSLADDKKSLPPPHETCKHAFFVRHKKLGIIQQTEGVFQVTHIYLLVSCGRLYLVSDRLSRHTDRCILDLKAFSLSLSSSKDASQYYWEPVSSLGDQVFVVSDYVAFSVSAQDLGWDRGNFLLFTQEDFGRPEDNINSNFKLNCHCCALYSFEDGKIYNAEHLPSKFTETFWPVPSWLDSKTIIQY